MKISGLVRDTFSAAFIGAVLAGCSAGGSQIIGGPRAAAIGHALAMTNIAGLVPQQYVSRQKSWVSPQWRSALRSKHKKTKLLWISDLGYAAVEAYDYETGALIGEVTGFSYPYGLCSDKNGNVYVSDFSLDKGFEIQAGTFKIINSWPTGGEAIGCSVSNGGDVAFTNFYPGGVVIFPGGGPTGHTYSGPGYDWAAGYDPNGNLFVECNYASPCSSPRIAELPAGGSSWISLNFSSGIGFAAAVQWDGKYLALADQACGSTSNTCIDQVTVSGSTVTLVNRVRLSAGSSGCSNYVDISGSWGFNAKDPNGILKREATALASPNLSCFPSPVLIWPYPAGGAPKRVLQLMPSSSGYGATITKI
ncbi:MAG: hypothetical protein JO146_09240 [Candidatus Eremiobacteraeota bacterium]|nr:hypothetical protein [Candidatus Eremiobacteraeota bacterium]